MAYRSAEFSFLLYTNNGTRNMNEDFAYEFLDRDGCREAPLSQLINTVIHQYLPSQAGMYVLTMLTKYSSCSKLIAFSALTLLVGRQE